MNRSPTRSPSRARLAVVLLSICAACNNKISSDREAEVAWLGLEESLDRALALGLKGYSEASSANIDAQEEAGEVTGTMTVTGQADQGSSDNKGLRLDVALVDYSDEILIDFDGDGEDEELIITYDTNPDDPPYFDLKLRDVPDGTIEGTLSGDYDMRDDLQGIVQLNLALDGALESDPEISGGTRISAGTLHVTGTAGTENGDSYDVDVTH